MLQQIRERSGVRQGIGPTDSSVDQGDFECWVLASRAQRWFSPFHARPPVPGTDMPRDPQCVGRPSPHSTPVYLGIDFPQIVTV